MSIFLNVYVNFFCFVFRSIKTCPIDNFPFIVFQNRKKHVNANLHTVLERSCSTKKKADIVYGLLVTRI